MKKTSFFAIGLSLILASCNNITINKTTQNTSFDVQNDTQTNFATAQIAVDPKTGQEFANNQLIVSLAGQDAQKLAERLDARIIDSIPQLDTIVLALPNNNALDVSRRLNTEGQVNYAQPNFIYKNDRVVEKELTQDEKLKNMAVRDRFDELPQYALDSNHLAAESAWMLGVTGKDVLVSVIDDPVDVTHPDLKANWAGKAYDAKTGKTFTSAQAWIDNIDGMGRYPQPIDNKVHPSIAHGTAVASTISAAKDGKGIAGLAPHSKYISAAIFAPGSVGSAKIVKAILWSVENNAQILNNSWGGPGFDHAIKSAFDYALERNITVVVSSSNSYREEYSLPALYAGVIPVGALSPDNTKAPFSTFGRHLSVSAPGVDVLMSSPVFINNDGTRKSGATPKDGSGYTLMSGTSFSGPYTAAAAALVLGEKPHLDPYQVRRLLETTADYRVGPNPNGFDLETGWGAVNATRLANVLKISNKLPAKGGNLKVRIEVKQPDGSYAPTPHTSDVIITRPENGDDTKGQIYGAQTNAKGEARFLMIAPGTYTVRVGSPNLKLGDLHERGTAVTQVTVTSSTPKKPTELVIKLDKGYIPPVNPDDVSVNDPNEPNDSIKEATKIQVGGRIDTGVIYNPKCKVSEPDTCDVDFYQFDAKAGKNYEINLYDRFHPKDAKGKLWGTIYLRNAKGEVLKNEEGKLIQPGFLDRKITFTAPNDGTYYLQVGSFLHITPTVGERPYKGRPSNKSDNVYGIEVLGK